MVLIFFKRFESFERENSFSSLSNFLSLSLNASKKFECSSDSTKKNLSVLNSSIRIVLRVKHESVKPKSLPLKFVNLFFLKLGRMGFVFVKFNVLFFHE